MYGGGKRGGRGGGGGKKGRGGGGGKKGEGRTEGMNYSTRGKEGGEGMNVRSYSSSGCGQQRSSRFNLRSLSTFILGQVTVGVVLVAWSTLHTLPPYLEIIYTYSH